MMASGQLVADSLSRTIVEYYTRIVSAHGVPDRRLDVDTRGTARDEEGSDPPLCEETIQVGLIQAAEAMRVEDDIVGLRCQLREHVGVPGIGDQHATLSPVWNLYRLSDAERQMPHAVWSVGGTKVREIGTEAHFQI